MIKICWMFLRKLLAEADHPGSQVRSVRSRLHMLAGYLYGVRLTREQFYHFQLDLTLKDKKGGDISSFIPNGEWDLIGK